MAGSLDGMPYRSRHSVGHRLVDGFRDKPIIQTLPHVDPTFDRCNVERPTPVEELTIANESVRTMSEAFGACFAEVGFEIRSNQDLSIVVVDGLQQLLEEGPRNCLVVMARVAYISRKPGVKRSAREPPSASALES